MRMWVLVPILFAFAFPVMADENGDENDEPTLYERHEAIAGEPVNRIRYTRIHGWTPVGDDNLVAETRRGKFWLIDLEPKCVLRLDLRILLEGRQQRPEGFSEISRFDTLKVDDQECSVRRIRPLDAEGVKTIRESS
ncbi:DUF6491 family protein [Natronospira bacteriovora]|uniref:DUF6491 family protein n=1 Tax=Natronospira bacteriovora TaxID=3069753 RepID=A0ABU0WBN8_9GAMM|nr:DUF6491 family protein [Natronospira sp. AB-CW4]MDQ2070885.1 DUF6491 family protein [Natronospira sp. AB-CW4]